MPTWRRRPSRTGSPPGCGPAATARRTGSARRSSGGSESGPTGAGERHTGHNYPAVAPTDGRSCYPLVPLSADDLAYFDELLRRTNAMIAEQADANDAEFVDTYAESVGHDVCTLPPTRWFEGVVPTMPAYPVHPNVLGEASMARSVLRVLGQPQPAPSLVALQRTARSVLVGRAARFTYTLSRAASMSFALQRSLGRGRYGPARGVATVNAAAGAHTLKLTAKQVGRRPGLYRLSGRPARGPQTVRFRIRRR